MMRYFIIFYVCRDGKGQMAPGNCAVNISHGGFPNHANIKQLIEADGGVNDVILTNVLELPAKDFEMWNNAEAKVTVQGCGNGC